MKINLVSSVAFGLVSVFGLSAYSGEGCCASGKKIALKTPLIEKANTLAAKWTEAHSKQVSEQDMVAMKAAIEVTSQICPVCKAMPDTKTFLSGVLCCSMSLEKTAMECASKEENAKQIPAEAKAAMQERMAVLASTEALISAAFAGCGSETTAKTCSKPEGEVAKKEATGCTAKDGVAKAGCSKESVACMEKLSQSADRLISTWENMPAQFASMSTADLTKLQGALAVLNKNGQFEMFKETMLTSADTMARAMELDSNLQKGCREHFNSVKEKMSAEDVSKYEEMSKTFAARTQLWEKTSKLFAAMNKVFAQTAKQPDAKVAQGQ